MAVACCIVDDHSDVVPFILSSVRAKRLLQGLRLVHFDSHPDLSLPSCPNPNSAASWQAKTLYEDLLSHNEGCIAEWIVPLVYTGVIGENVTWIRPPWSHQFHDGTYSFAIGDRRGVGSCAVTLLEPYYISEGVAVENSELENGKHCTLVVSTVDDFTHGGEAYILDVCLDYFVTANPFLGKVVAALGEAGHVLQPLIDMYQSVYELCRGEEHGGDRALRAVEYVVLHGARGEETDVGDTVERGIDSFLVLCEVDALTREARELIVATKFLLLLPHCLPSDVELDESLLRFKEVVSSLKAPPSLITIARSAEDGYTPSERVEYVQQRVLDSLRSFLGVFALELEQHDLTEDPLERCRLLFLNQNAKRYVVTRDVDVDVNVKKCKV